MSDKPKFPVGSRMFNHAEPTSAGKDDDDATAHNPCTVICTTVGRLALPPVGTRRAFDAIHSALVHVNGESPGVLVGVVGPAGSLVGHAVVAPNQSLVIGRHTACRIRLEDPNVSLRQLAIFVELGGLGVRTHLWDLQTQTPFHTEDGAMSSAVVADGSLFVTLGQYTIALVPTEPAQATDLEQAWSALAPRDFQSQQYAYVPPERSPEPAKTDANNAPITRGRSVTRITRIPHATSLSRRAVPRHMRFARITIADDQRPLVHELSLEDLRRGVLVGRYERCEAGRHSDDSVSRVHLLVVAIADKIWAIDTASSNGTTRNERVVQTVQLASQDELVLADETVLHWEAVARAVA